jgi:hypothetical protein
MRASTDRSFGPDRQCEIAVPALGRRRGIIRWCRDAHIGIAFKQPLTFPEFAAWRQTLAAIKDQQQGHLQ